MSVPFDQDALPLTTSNVAARSAFCEVLGVLLHQTDRNSAMLHIPQSMSTKFWVKTRYGSEIQGQMNFLHFTQLLDSSGECINNDDLTKPEVVVESPGSELVKIFKWIPKGINGPAQRFAKCEDVEYKSSKSVAWVPAKILQVGLDGPQGAYYQIQLRDGQVKDTIDARLRKLAVRGGCEEKSDWNPQRDQVQTLTFSIGPDTPGRKQRAVPGLKF